ncbi:Formate/nitrite transporter [Teratosphaeria destructans]|uniref:Formate/nitrite transporter n=1 Tax=Teratosphaeria destructans TaxID=418781 RepID=A0A9W7SIA7_9PEZI|nr:Formate/nitrite transporter [Teratosphaeria destructans]
MQSPVHVIVNCYTPKETVELCSRAGVAKANMRLDKMFFSSFMAGCLLAFACAALLSTNTAPWYQENAPGLIRMIGALIFPFGLVTIVVTGADLCTGSFLYTTVSCLHRRLSPLKMLIHWFVTFWGNLAGSLFVMAIIIGYGDVFKAAAYHTEVENFANTKVVTPEWHDIFLRGIGANWLVCLACFLAFSAREYFSKVVAIWWPTFAFVCLGLDHVVANMFFVPAAIFLGAPKISVGYYIWQSMIPALIGNIIGGGLFVGVVYWYLYLTGDTTPIPIDGASFADDKAPLVGESVNSSTEHSTPEPSKMAEQMV